MIKIMQKILGIPTIIKLENHNFISQLFSKNYIYYWVYLMCRKNINQH
jgi:hypothetical protein